jgi:low temperature requirement protein LtrA
MASLKPPQKMENISVQSQVLSFEIDNNDPNTSQEIAAFMSKFSNVRKIKTRDAVNDGPPESSKQVQHGAEHKEFPPFFSKPVARQFWLSSALGGGSSLKNEASHRVATTNDLVLDLVVVFILQQIVHIVTTSSLLGHEGATHGTSNATVSDGGGGHRFLAAGYRSSGGRSLLTTWDHFKDTRTPEWLQFLTTFRDVCAVYVPIWANWFRIATLLNRFEAYDVINYLIFACNLVLMLFVGRGVDKYISVPKTGGEPDCDDFLYALVAMQVMQMVWCAYIAFNNPQFARELANLSINIAITASLYVLAALSAEWNNVEVFLCLDWAGKFSDLFFLIRNILPALNTFAKATCCRCTRLCFSARSQARLPPVNTPLIAERLELFLILCIGESIAAADPKGAHEVEDSSDLMFLLGVVMVTVCLKCLTVDFDIHPTASDSSDESRGSSGAKHALATSGSRGASWILVQFPIGLGILYSAAALEVAAGERGLTWWRRLGLTVGIFFVAIFSTVSQALHKGRGGGRRCRKRTRITFRSTISCLLLILPALWPQDDEWGKPAANGFIYAIALILVVLLVSDRYAREVVADPRTDRPYAQEDEGEGGTKRVHIAKGRSRNSFAKITAT